MLSTSKKSGGLIDWWIHPQQHDKKVVRFTHHLLDCFFSRHRIPSSYRFVTNHKLKYKNMSSRTISVWNPVHAIQKQPSENYVPYYWRAGNEKTKTVKSLYIYWELLIGYIFIFYTWIDLSLSKFVSSLHYVPNSKLRFDHFVLQFLVEFSRRTFVEIVPIKIYDLWVFRIWFEFDLSFY